MSNVFELFIKYYERGFDGILVDPYCFHEKQCQHGVNTTFRRYEDEEEDWKWEKAKWASRDLHDNYKEMLEEAESGGNMGNGDVYCCCRLSPIRHIDYFSLSLNQYYSIMLMEKSLGHGSEYFTERFQWTEKERQTVNSVVPSRRIACSGCRREYAMQLVFAEAPAVESDDDVLHGDFAYKHQTDEHFGPSFYGAGAFSSEYVAGKARSVFELLSVLRSQYMAEMVRYIQRHKTDEGFVNRFVYGIELPELFRKASLTIFPISGRAPVGLNPERFVGVCEHCSAFLANCEFGTKFCATCSS